MKKTYKLIILIAIILILVSVFKKDEHEEYLKNATLDELLTDIPTQEVAETRTIDFSKCDEKDSYKLDYSLGTASLEIFGVDDANQFCEFETSLEIGNGYNVNDCKIPLTVGEVEFGETDFTVFSKYCVYKD